MYVVAMLMFIAILTVSIAALIAQHGTTLPGSVKAMTWATMAYLVVVNAISSVHTMVYMIAHPSFGTQASDVSRAIFDIPPLESPFKLGMMILSILVSLWIGAGGLLALRRFRKQSSQPPPAPPPIPQPVPPLPDAP